MHSVVLNYIKLVFNSLKVIQNYTVYQPIKQGMDGRPLKLYLCRDHRAHHGLGLDESEFTKSVVVFIFYFIRRYNIREERCCYSIVFIAGITPTNDNVSYIVKNSTHTSESSYGHLR